MDRRLPGTLLLAAGAALAAWGLALGPGEGGPLSPGEAPPGLPGPERPGPGTPPAPPPAQASPPRPGSRARSAGGAPQERSRKPSSSFSFQVRVLRAEAQAPLAGVRLLLYGPLRGGFSEAPPDLLARARTDACGEARLTVSAPPPWILEARCPGRARLRRTLEAPPPGREPLVLRLAPGGTLTGRVVDRASGLPLPGASVRALPAGGTGPAETVRTDRRGIFRLSGLTREAPYRLILTARGYEESAPRETFRPGDPFRDFPLRPKRRLPVTLLLPAGTQPPQVLLLRLLAASPGSAPPDLPLFPIRSVPWPREGRLAFPLPGPGRYRLRAETPPGTDPALAGISRPFRVRPGQGPLPALELPLSRALLLEGRVLDGPGGPPLPGVRIQCPSRGERTRTDRAGRFRLVLSGPPAERLLLRIPGKRAAFVALPPLPAGGRVPLGDLVLPGRAGTLRGVLRDSSGRPLEGKRLHLGGEGLDPWEWPVETGREGRFLLEGIPFGDLEIRLDGKVLERFRLSPRNPALTLNLILPENKR